MSYVLKYFPIDAESDGVFIPDMLKPQRNAEPTETGGCFSALSVGKNVRGCLKNRMWSAKATLLHS
jgi:hypothetical protein